MSQTTEDRITKLEAEIERLEKVVTALTAPGPQNAFMINEEGRVIVKKYTLPEMGRVWNVQR